MGAASLEQHSQRVALAGDFGRELLAIVDRMPVWIVGSEDNRSAAMEARSSFGSSADMTTFSPTVYPTQEELLLRMLVNIDEHHGPSSFPKSPYEEVVVIGAQPEWLSQELLAELSLGEVTRFERGFTLRRLSPTSPSI